MREELENILWHLTLLLLTTIHKNFDHQINQQENDNKIPKKQNKMRSLFIF